MARLCLCDREYSTLGPHTTRSGRSSLGFPISVCPRKSAFVSVLTANVYTRCIESLPKRRCGRPCALPAHVHVSAPARPPQRLHLGSEQERNQPGIPRLHGQAGGRFVAAAIEREQQQEQAQGSPAACGSTAPSTETTKRKCTGPSKAHAEIAPKVLLSRLGEILLSITGRVMLHRLAGPAGTKLMFSSVM